MVRSFQQQTAPAGRRGAEQALGQRDHVTGYGTGSFLARAVVPLRNPRRGLRVNSA